MKQMNLAVSIETTTPKFSPSKLLSRYAGKTIREDFYIPITTRSQADIDRLSAERFINEIKQLMDKINNKH